MFNIAKGRVVQWYNEIEANSPNANAAFILVPLSASDTAANVQDADDLTAALATAMNEQAAGSWVRKTLESVELVALPAPNDGTDCYEVSVPSVTWTSPDAGSNTTGLLICIDLDTTAGTDANIIPIAHYDFVVTADENDVVLNAGIFFRAT